MVVVTEVFENLARTAATAKGFGALRVHVLPHPMEARPEIEVEQIGIRMLGDQRGCLGWDQVEPRLRSRQRGEDVQPSLQPSALLEDRCQLRGAPKVAVLLGVT